MKYALLTIFCISNTLCMYRGYEQLPESKKQSNAIEKVQTTLVSAATKYKESRALLKSNIKSGNERLKDLTGQDLNTQKETLIVLNQELATCENNAAKKLGFYDIYNPDKQTPQEWYDSLDWQARKEIAQALYVERNYIQALPDDGCTIL